MKALVRRWRLAGLIVAVFVVTSGCNLPSLVYFLAPQDPACPPECAPLAAPKKELKIAFLVHTGPETRSEFIRVDRDLAEVLVRNLKKRFADNKDKIVVVPPNQVEVFKDRQPDWNTMGWEKV